MKIENINKILIIKPRGIGDVVLSTILFKNIKNAFPYCQLDYLTEKVSSHLLKNIELLDNVLIFNNSSLVNKIKTISLVFNNKYDLVIDLYGNPFTAQITYFSFAKYRLGYPLRGRKYAYNLFGPEERNNYHSAEINLNILKALDIPITKYDINIPLLTEITNYADDYFMNFNKKFIIGICPTGGWESKRISPSIFIKLIIELEAKYDAEFLLLWGPGDENDVQEIFQSSNEKIKLAPKTNILELAALINNCSIVIANDSGPMHISAALGVPTLAIHGPTNPKLQGPYGTKHSYIRKEDLHCIGCDLLVCKFNQECFNELSIEDIINEVDLLIKKNKLNIYEKY